MFFNKVLILGVVAWVLLGVQSTVAASDSCVSIGAAATDGSSAFHSLGRQLGGLDHALVYYNPFNEDNRKKPYDWVSRSYLDKNVDVILALVLREDKKGAPSKGNLSKIKNGVYDTVLRELAKAIARDGRTIVLRPLYEFNGNWYPWQAYFKGNDADDFAPAWKRIVSIFRDAGAPVLFDLNYNRNSAGSRGTEDFATLYPGDEYVDVVSISSYNRCGSSKQHKEWKSFSEEFRPAYERIAEISSRPIAVAETSTTSMCGGDKAAWISELFEDLAREYPRVVNVTFYLDTKRAGTASNAVDLHWELETDAQVSAFRGAKQKLYDTRGKCDKGSVVGVPNPHVTSDAGLLLLTRTVYYEVPRTSVNITYPWAVYIEGTSYLDETSNDAINPITGEEFGKTGNLLRWQLKQGMKWHTGSGTFGPWISNDGVLSGGNKNRWWENRYGFGVGVEYCTDKPSFADWGSLCTIAGYQYDKYTVPVPERLDGVDDKIYIRLRFNTGGQW